MIGRIVHFSDVHLNLLDDNVKLPPKYGSDPPIQLLMNALEFAAKEFPDPDVFFYTGDSVIHEPKVEEKRFHWKQDEIRAVVEAVIEKFYCIYGEESERKKKVKMITTVFGNADATPNYALDITDGKTDNPTLKVISSAWKTHLTTEQLEEFKKGGYTFTHIEEKLAVITLNTAPYAEKHPGEDTLADPLGQFAWLERTLANLERKGIYVYLLGHIPPILHVHDEGYQWKSRFIEKFKDVIKPFVKIIKAQIYGHVHTFELRAFEVENILVPLFTISAISPKYWNSPSFTVWKYDKKTYELLDYQAYGSRKEPFTKWEPIFSATQQYNLEDLSKKSVKEFTEKFIEKGKINSTLFAAYDYNRYVQSPYAEDCKCESAQARANVLCSFVWYTDEKDVRECLKKKATILESLGSPKGDRIKLVEGPTTKDHIAEHRMLYPATEDGPTKKPAFNKPWTSATVYLTIISLLLILIMLAKILGIKARWTRSIKGDRWIERTQ
ncbi:unnamed protein product [Albugo candida]|uniref:Uncharacterized protein n=2 Tax=Albugo candida TaxID=65357 RepID=A0A024GVS8_9STRA|nr:unnamed protein product [Albugo candida]|eukprot:CCI50808.1 unnamed protein product [Albugo candida]